MSTSYGTPIAQSFPKFQHPSHELLKENNFVWQVYHKYHAKCLKGKCSGQFFIVHEIFILRYFISFYNRVHCQQKKKKRKLKSLFILHFIFRTEKTWSWSFSGNEYTLQILVFLFAATLQPQNVSRVSTVGRGRLRRGIQVLNPF